MNRREFVKSSVAATGLGLGAAKVSAQGTGSGAGREFYELRQYHLRRGPQTGHYDHFYSTAAIPAYNRAGVDRVGVFNVSVGPESPTMYVLLVHKNLESVLNVANLLVHDAEYQKAGADFINAPATNPSFMRVESSLMISCAGVNKLEAPTPGPRLFELRTYESHSKKACKKKIEMFEKSETAIFRRCGLQPVFFGETLVGDRLPNLTYMLVYPDQEAHDKNWAKFIADPEWQKLRSTPGYTDAEIVSNVSNIFLRPTSYSQI